MTRKEKRALRRTWQLENIVLYEDFDDDTLDYIWSTQSIVEAIDKRLSHWLDIHSVEITCSVILATVAFSTIMVGYILYISFINH